MPSQWPEITTVLKESRKELVISGSEDVLSRIEAGGIDERLYALKEINFLEVAKCKLTEISPRIGEMVGLTSLVLCNNLLTTIPDSIGMLSKLSLLDLSYNKLETLPALDKLSNLDTLNVSSNNLTSLPNMSSLANLHVVFANNNQLTEFPVGLLSDKLVHLHTLMFADNEIGDIPDSISCLKALKNFDLSNNKVKIVPSELSLCLKLKDLAIRGNKLADRRLQKLVDQLHTKHVTDYLTQMYEKDEEKRKQAARNSAKGERKADGKENATMSTAEEVREESDKRINVRVIHFDAGLKCFIEMKESVVPVRPHILACIVRNLDLKRTTNSFKRFIALQNNLHDTVCEKRQIATIAAHDMNACFFPMYYMGKPKAELELTPLFGTKPVSAKQMVDKLVKEADEIRRLKKRSALSGVHKYLDMVKRAETYACLVDGQGVVISFPPITNAAKTKCVPSTRDVLLEVTSSVSTDACRKAMTALIHEIIGLGTNPPPQDDSPPFQLVIEQVRVHDETGQLRSVFPSSTDLKDDEKLNVNFIYPDDKNREWPALTKK